MGRRGTGACAPPLAPRPLDCPLFCTGGRHVLALPWPPTCPCSRWASPPPLLARVLCARRALLYKRLADMVGLDCRVVKGRNYADGDDDAKVVVVLDGTEHYLGARALRSDVCVQVRHGGTVGGGGGRGWGRHK